MLSTSPGRGGRYHKISDTGPLSVWRTCHERSATSELPTWTMKFSNPALANKAMPPHPEQFWRSWRETRTYPGSSMLRIALSPGNNVSFSPTKVGNPKSSSVALNSSLCETKPRILIKYKVKLSALDLDLAADAPWGGTQGPAAGGSETQVSKETSPLGGLSRRLPGHWTPKRRGGRGRGEREEGKGEEEGGGRGGGGEGREGREREGT